MSEQLSNIERALGEVQGTMKSILREMEREREDASKARARMYKRIEEVDAKVEKVEETAVLAGQVAAQARDANIATTKLVTDDIKPQTDKLKSLGIKGTSFFAGAALVGGLVSAPLFTSIASAFEKVFKP